ncbi:MAG: hypothetical protein DMG24_11315 [Acidobacteria bacterium]|nr:MAG: hypothetical protein DMG24_11315 [Acidobacteriota bacterium]
MNAWLRNPLTRRLSLATVLTALFCALLFAGRNEILGEVRLHASSRVEKNSGVWIDSQYVGYLKELRGSKKILLMPGEHAIVVRQAGYKDFESRVAVEPGQKVDLAVRMERDLRARYPNQTALVKILVRPERAAVFVDGLYEGHVDEFNGLGKGLLVSPGKHRFKITLPGYQDFETEVSLLANQRFELKTDLFGEQHPASP